MTSATDTSTMNISYDGMNISEYFSLRAYRYEFDDYILLSVYPIGIVTTFLSIIVFANKKVLSQSNVFKYDLTISIVDFSYICTLLIGLVIITSCYKTSLQCGETWQYISLVVWIVASDYLSSALALTSILLSIFLGFQRLYILLNKETWMKKIKLKYVNGVILAFCFISYLPILFRKRISSHLVTMADNSTILEYKLRLTDFGTSGMGRYTPTILSTIRLALAGPIMFTLNLVVIYAFRRFIDNKKKRAAAPAKRRASSFYGWSSNFQMNHSLTLLLISTSFLYTIGNLPFLVYYSMVHAQPGYKSVLLDWMGRFFLVAFIILKTIVYLIFNKFYRRQFKEYFLDYVFCCFK